MKAARTIVGILALAATGTATGTAPGRCEPGQWLADPGISPPVLAANGYRVVTRQTLNLGNGRQAIDTVAANGSRLAKCRVVYDEDGSILETTCYLPCRDG